MTEKNAVVDRNDKLKDRIQKSRTIVLQKLSTTMMGGLIEP
jgi:hypothetical protein